METSKIEHQKTLFKMIMILTIGILSSCVSFEKGVENPNKLTKGNYSNLNGKYSINAFNEEKIIKKHWMYNNFLQELDRKLLSDTLKIDSAKIYAVELTMINDKRLKIDYLENDRLIRERLLAVRLKRDGYLYLKNKNIGFVLVPYIAGALDIKKTRLSKTENGDLIFDVVHHRSGAFMIIAFLDGRTWHYRKVYPENSSAVN